MKKKIAILADFPAWIIDDTIPKPNAHFHVWLVSLYQAIPKLCNQYDFHWITFNKNVKSIKCIKSKGQYFHILPGTSLRLGQFLHYIRERYLISKLLKIIIPDILHVWGTETYHAIAGKNFKGIKILSMQGILSAYAERCKLSKFEIKQGKLELTTLPAYPIITAESSWASNICKKISPNSHVMCWEYAANEAFFNVQRTPSVKPSCLIAGTANDRKDIKTAITAFSKPELAHINLYMAGANKADYPSLPKNIIPLGRVSREEMRELLSTTWCLVHPSLADSCPNIVKEARVVGIPCIVTHECGAKQYISDGNSGYIIPIKSPDILAQKVLKITKDIQTSIDMGEYDHERCRMELSSQIMITNLVNIYEKISTE